MQSQIVCEGGKCEVRHGIVDEDHRTEQEKAFDEAVLNRQLNLEQPHLMKYQGYRDHLFELMERRSSSTGRAADL